MSIDIRQLGEAAQKQVLRKIQEQEDQRQGMDANKKQKSNIRRVDNFPNVPSHEKRKDSNKYGARTVTENGMHFDSQLEADRYRELVLLLRGGEISQLRIHPEFTLLEGFTTPEGERVRREYYEADFSYVQAGRLIVEDCKSEATKTAVYKHKKKWMLALHGIKIREITREMVAHV